MFNKASVVRRIAATLVAAGLAVALAQDVKPDNTKMNKGDGSKGAMTADQQKMNPTDRKTTQNIRKALIADKSLSTYAHNVKVIAVNGKVTLKGPVRSDVEKQAVASKATEIAGADNVINEITVQPPSK